MSELLVGRVVGGLFALAPSSAPDGEPPPFLPEHPGRLVWLGRARHGLALLAERLPARRIFLPTYLCPALLEGLPSKRLAWFRVDDQLRPDRAALSNAGTGDIVVLIAYFGWPVDSDDLAAARANGAFVLVDASQALLTRNVGAGAHWTLFSPRKHVGVSSGGLLVAAPGAPWPLEGLELPPPPPAWVALSDQAAAQRATFDRAGGCGADRAWFAAFREAESATVPPCTPTPGTVERLSACFCYSGHAAARRANAATLHELLGDLTLLPPLPSGAVPLGVPLALPTPHARELVRARLHAGAVYAPWHWDLGAVPDPATAGADPFAGARALAARQLTIPCDQRYTPQEMGVVAAEIRRVLAN